MFQDGALVSRAEDCMDRMAVTSEQLKQLRPDDGSLQEVRVLKSSGHRQLDTAALATVRQAAPFQPFNVEMRKAYDRLEFTRWWQFTKLRSGLQSRPG